MLLDELIDISAIETVNMETKLKLDRTNVEGWLKTIAGFSNASGGKFFIGVEDGTNKLIGFDRNGADKERNFFNNQINEHIFPRPLYHISFIRYENNQRELFVIQVDVKESPVKPIILKFNNVPSIYMRREGFTNGATYEEIISMSIQSQKAQYDVTDSDLNYNRADFSKLLQFYSEHNEGKDLSDKALASLGFFNKDKKLKNGAFLFADGCKDSKTEVMCSVFSGFNKGSERVVTVNRFTGCLTDSLAFMMEFVKQRMNHSFIKHADGRENIDSYPERALFEGFINAIAHRDYFLDGTQIQLDMFKDRLEISSPGSFYQGEKIGKTYDLSNVISKRRNELICGILVKCNVMEAAGTGFDKISQDYEKADSNHKPFIYSTSDHFTLVLPDLTFTEGVSGGKALLKIDFIPAKNATEHDEKVLAYCFEKSRKVAEIANFLGLSNSSYLREKILQNLESQGYLIKITSGRTNLYRTNPDLVKG
ncbi:MAG: putative DNA binding domain-containing protein [Treponema sp.]|nr:putative DNA binding domain-containing protein [Candidatus Treponema equifaecale]